MAVILGEYIPPGGELAAEPAACCSSCATPEERRRRRRLGAGAVAAAVAARNARAGVGRSGLGDGDEVDPIFWWPSDIKALVDRANTEIWALARDYSEAIKAGRISSAQLASFKDFFNEWTRYHDGLSTWAKLSGGTAATVKSYRVRAAGWRKILIEAGARTSAPAPTGLPSKPTDWEGIAKWAAAGAIVIGGAIAIGHVVRFIPKPKGA